MKVLKKCQQHFKSKMNVCNKVSFDSCKAKKFCRKLKKAEENSFTLLAWQKISYLLALLLFFFQIQLFKNNFTPKLIK